MKKENQLEKDIKKLKKELKNWVDICGGKMTLDELAEEIKHYMYYKTPDNLIVTIERDDKIKGYRSTIYLSKKDFEKPYR
jgi:predicted translin family RNA/ssDNA-binding protein